MHDSEFWFPTPGIFTWLLFPHSVKCKHLETLTFCSVLKLINGTVIDGSLVLLVSPGSWIRFMDRSLEIKIEKL